MEIRIDNLKFVILLIFSFVVFVVYRESLGEFFSQIQLLSSGEPPEEKLKGLIPFTILAITFAGLVRMFIQPSGRND